MNGCWQRRRVDARGGILASVAMDVDLLQLLGLRTQQTQSGTDLIACSLCLSVLHGSEWIEAEQAIRAIRSYELHDLPRLQPAVCDSCAERIFSRRARAGELIAA